MRKRRAERALAVKRASAPRAARSMSQSQNASAQSETNEHPILTLQHQLGNHKVSRLIAAQQSGMRSAGEVLRKKKAPTQTITFSEDEAPIIVGHVPGQKSAIIDEFFDQFGTKLLATAAQFDRALTNFSDEMRFPPNKKAEPDFKDVFLDQLWDVVKEGYDKLLKPVLEEELPGIGTAISLVSAMQKEVNRARDVAGQLAIRDFLVQTRTSYGDAITGQINAFIANAAVGRQQAQTTWSNANTQEDERAITGPMDKFLKQPIPSASEFQKGIVSAYVRSQQGKSESEFLDIKMLGRIQVRYDEDGKFEDATVQLASGSGSDQVADQINRLYHSPIDLRNLHTQISVGVYGEGIAGGKAYYYVILNPPDFTPYAPIPRALTRFNALTGDPLTVPKVTG